MSSSKLSRNLTTCTCTGVIIIAASLLFYFIKQRKRHSSGQCLKMSNCLDGKFQFVQAGKVEQLFVYPIKSCKGINVSQQQYHFLVLYLRYYLDTIHNSYLFFKVFCRFLSIFFQTKIHSRLKMQDIFLSQFPVLILKCCQLFTTCSKI